MPSNTTAIWILCVTFCVFLLLRFPVALVLVISSIATLWYLDMPIVVVAQQTIQGINFFSLLAIPFFIMTGQLLGAGGLASRIVDFANVFVGTIYWYLFNDVVPPQFLGRFWGLFRMVSTGASSSESRSSTTPGNWYRSPRVSVSRGSSFHLSCT